MEPHRTHQIPHNKCSPSCSFVRESQSLALKAATPKHLQFKTEDSRWASFDKWNSPTFPDVTGLAQAGFFYLGHRDSVKCYFCGGCLRDWKHDDDPWNEHARWFPDCPYVKQMKGKAYIESVLEEDDYRHMKSGKAVLQHANHSVNQTAAYDSNHETQVKNAATATANQGEDFSSEDDVFVTEVDNSRRGQDIDRNGLLVRESRETTSEPQSSSHQESLTLREENRQLKDQNLCKICLDLEISVAYIPCGHLVCCSECAPTVHFCPICRAKISKRVRTYLA